MILVHYESYKGGVNNLAVAIETKTGRAATSIKGKEAAVRNLKRIIRREAKTWQH